MLIIENKILKANLKFCNFQIGIEILFYLVNLNYSNYLSPYWHFKQDFDERKFVDNILSETEVKILSNFALITSGILDHHIFVTFNN